MKLVKRFSLKIVFFLCSSAALLPVRSSAAPDGGESGVSEWPTEVVSSQIQSHLETLVGTYLNEGRIASELKLARSAQCTTLDPGGFVTLRDDGQASIQSLKSAQSKTPGGRKQPLEPALASILEPLSRTTEHVGKRKGFRLKVSRILIQDESVTARVLLFAHGEGMEGEVQLNSTWFTHWNLEGVNGQLQLREIEVLAHEKSVLKSQSPWFSDATAALFAGDESFSAQVSYGMGDWLNRIERYGGISIYSRHGLALGDANGDGLDDLYLCQPGGLPNRLYLRQADGTLADHSASSQVDWLDDTRSAIFADFDNDGDQDLIIGTFVGAYLCRNDGGGTFERAGSLPGIGRDISSLSAVDYDNDGFLDIHVCVYDSEARIEGRDKSNVYDSRASGGTNRLYRNRLGGSEGRWEFEDVTSAVGLDDGNARFSLAAAWEDFDGDGDQDLYIANDFGKNCLYKNDRGKFVNVSLAMGVEDYGPGMSVAWGDTNRDGNPDLYVANMFSAAGNRITRQDGFQVTAHGTTRESFHRFNKGNSLYTFNGERFEEVPDAGGAGNAQWAWSSLLGDIDNDGWEDALVANGYITGPGGGDL